jgi:LmbE family N-acetylglucosaminyl deacetylase
MQIYDLRQIHDTYQHIYLSPHLDDAALSCGGMIAAQRERDERVLVVTICTGSPSPDATLNPLAQELHANWQLSAETAVAARIAEDQAAMDVLDADYFYLGLLDAIYRHPAYCTRESLFGQPVADDPLSSALRVTLTGLQRRAPTAVIYSPLGVGSHVDHLNVYAVCAGLASQLSTLRFYEELPYALVDGSVAARVATVAKGLEPQLVEISPWMERKILSIAAYASQMAELFGSLERMAPLMRDYAASISPDGASFCERLWR